MKKRLKIILTIILIVLVIVGMFFGIVISVKHVYKVKREKRYVEIKENVKKGVEWMISAQYPGCSISKKHKNAGTYSSFSNSPWLISQGYIKKSELLDVDGYSYCDAYVEVYPYFENPLDQQHDCEVFYKIYLKCKNYEEKGYKDWEH